MEEHLISDQIVTITIKIAWLYQYLVNNEVMLQILGQNKDKDNRKENKTRDFLIKQCINKTCQHLQ